MEIIIALCFIVFFVFIIRAFGAWMLRIDEVIDNQKEQTKLLKSLSETIQEKRNTENRETDSK